MKTINLTADMKIRLLKAVRAGRLHPDDFPELYDNTPPNIQLFTSAERDAEIERLKRKLLND